MKKLFSVLLASALALACALPAWAATGPANITSEAYVVMDADTGQLLLAKNADEELQPASVTKIMTLGLACEKAQGDWTTQLTVSHDDVHTLYGTDSSHIALQEGEVVTLEQMLYATAVASANDAANVLAAYIGGSIEAGARCMTEKAQQLGLVHTQFVNPHGISEDGQYVSAGDLAVILRWALEQPGFYTLFTRSEAYYMEATNLQPQQRGFWLQDHMRMPASIYYIPEIAGSKIGYTNTARYTYACLAEKDGVRLICTVMKSELKYDKYADVASLLDYTFSHFRRVPLEGQAPQVTVQGGGAALGTVPATADGASLLLADGLTEDALALDTADAVYTLGGARPYATYRVNGQGIQEDTAVSVPLALGGLDLLVAQSADVQLAAAADVRPEKSVARLVPLAAAAGLVVGGGLLVWRRRRARNTKQLRKRAK